jgi:hypothetical protein
VAVTHRSTPRPGIDPVFPIRVRQLWLARFLHNSSKFRLLRAVSHSPSRRAVPRSLAAAPVNLNGKPRIPNE